MLPLGLSFMVERWVPRAGEVPGSCSFRLSGGAVQGAVKWLTCGWQAQRWWTSGGRCLEGSVVVAPVSRWLHTG